MCPQWFSKSWTLESRLGFPNPTIADAILDRLIHNAYRINLKGESMRKKKTNLTKNK